MAMPGLRHVSASVYHRDLDQNLPRPLSDIPEATQSQEASQVSLLSHISHLSLRISQALSHLPPPSEHTTGGEEPDYQSGLDSSQYKDAAEAESGWLGWPFCCWSEMDWRWSNSVSSDTIDGGVGWDDGKSARPYLDILRLVQSEPRPWTRPWSHSLTLSSTSTLSSTTSFPPPHS